MAKKAKGSRLNCDAGRARGAQPGNLSRLKHGFYSRRFTPEELVGIGRLAVAELSLYEEIAMLRVLMRRVLDAELSPRDAVELFGRATGQLRRLLKTKMELEAGGKSRDALSAAIDKALDELGEELGVDL